MFTASDVTTLRRGYEGYLRTPGNTFEFSGHTTLRRECLDHVIVFHPASLSRHLHRFLEYYHQSRCHLALAKDPPEPRPVQRPEQGRIIRVPQVGGLHHRYERRVA